MDGSWFELDKKSYVAGSLHDSLAQLGDDLEELEDLLSLLSAISTLSNLARGTRYI